MCGIAGFFCNTKKVDSRALSTAVYVMAKEMESRGTDSWGMMDTQSVCRGLKKISKGLRLPKYLPRAVAVHTRYATTGKVKQSNSHPFVVYPSAHDGDTVVGMHNGVISNHSALNKAYSRNCRVDSQHIFSHLADGLPFDDLEGYGTIVYSKSGRWFIGRFNGGELAVYQTRAGILFASTTEAIYKALDAANLWGGAFRIDTTQGTVYSFTQAGLRAEFAVNVKETKYLWDDTLYTDANGHVWDLTRGKSARWKDEYCPWCGGDPGTVDDGKCSICGELLGVDEPLDYTIEKTPQGFSVPCSECHEWINSGEEYAEMDGAPFCMRCVGQFEVEFQSEVDEPQEEMRIQ